SRVVEKSRMQRDDAAGGWSSANGSAKCRLNAFAAQLPVVVLNDCFGVALANRGGVCIGRVQQKLHGRGPAALQIAREVVGNDHAGIQRATADGAFEISD